jgi:hypothetical protein
MDIPYNDRAPLEPLAQIEEQAEEQGREAVQSSFIPKPEISIIVDGAKAIKPGMKSIFVEDDNSIIAGDATLDGGGYCTCNSVSVCTCNTVCTCESVCSCLAVCSCDGHCSCNQVCPCNSQCTCQNNTFCSCNQVCTCVPVH